MGGIGILGFGSDFDGIDAWPEGLGDPSAFPALLDALRKEVSHLVMYKTMPYARIELAKLGPDAGIIGAAMLGAV